MSAHLRYLALRARLAPIVDEGVALQAVAERIVAELYRSLPHYTAVVVFSVEATGLRAIAARGVEPDQAGVMATGVAGVAARGTAPVFIADAASDPRVRPIHAGICTELAVPVPGAGGPGLVLDVQSDRPNSLGPSDRQLLGWLAVALQARFAGERGMDGGEPGSRPGTI